MAAAFLTRTSLYVVPASKAPVAATLRRGPRKQV